ncbi:MAG: DUF1097 domain-containing protein [Acidocella sp.]|nr:DUF1097 domain-containing protein [Acidocella sp.]
MSFVNALGLVLAIIGGVLAYLYAGPLHNVYFIWAVFIFTATGVAIGGTNEAFKNLVICGIAGLILAWIAAMIIVNTLGSVGAALTPPVWIGIVVGVTTGFLAWIANIKLFPAIPATVVGYATAFGYMLQTPGILTPAVLTSFTFANPLIVLSISFVIAAVFGIVSLALAKKLSTPAAA